MYTEPSALASLSAADAALVVAVVAVDDDTGSDDELDDDTGTDDDDEDDDNDDDDDDDDDEDDDDDDDECAVMGVVLVSGLSETTLMSFTMFLCDRLFKIEISRIAVNGNYTQRTSTRRTQMHALRRTYK